MAKYYSIASGSKGNSGLLITKDKKILIDMGVSLKYLKESLLKHKIGIQEIDFVLITHEHVDHVKGLAMLCKNTQIPIYMTKKSFDNIKEKDKLLKNIKFFIADEKFSIDGIFVETFKTPHDSADSVGFFIKGEDFAFGYATDLGFMPKNIMEKIKTADMVVLEANYDVEMLKHSEYPLSVIKRIESTQGHLSNVDASVCVVDLIESGVSQIILAHISENNNTPENVYSEIDKSIKLFDLDASIGRNIHIAPVKNEYPIINLKNGIEEYA
ncbi:MAG: MBL fold metallo-hydrolase [Clostridia bacterium]